MNSVLNRFISAVKILLESKYVPHTQVAAVKDLPLTRNVTVGSAKLVAASKRDNKEPDIVFRTPKDAAEGRIRIVGELKFPGTCDLERWNDNESLTRKSMRHKFGELLGSFQCIC